MRKGDAQGVQDQEEFKRTHCAACHAYRVARQDFREESRVNALGRGAPNDKPGRGGDESKRADRSDGKPERRAVEA
jgi:hypothetical protein